MEDIMHIQSKFMRALLSAAITKALKKSGCKADLTLYDLRASHGSQDGKVELHIDMDVEIGEEDLFDILKKAGVL